MRKLGDLEIAPPGIWICESKSSENTLLLRSEHYEIPLGFLKRLLNDTGIYIKTV